MTAVPVTRTFVAGEIVLATHFNTNIRDPLNFLLARPLCQVRQTSSQTLADVTLTSITFTTEDVDTTGMHSNSTNTSRATAVYPGWYRRTGAVSQSANSTGVRIARWVVNGTTINSGQAATQAVATPYSSSTYGRGGLTYLNVGDYIEIQGFQSSGGNLGTDVSTEWQSDMCLTWESN